LKKAQVECFKHLFFKLWFHSKVKHESTAIVKMQTELIILIRKNKDRFSYIPEVCKNSKNCCSTFKVPSWKTERWKLLLPCARSDHLGARTHSLNSVLFGVLCVSGAHTTHAHVECRCWVVPRVVCVFGDERRDLISPPPRKLQAARRPHQDHLLSLSAAVTPACDSEYLWEVCAGVVLATIASEPYSYPTHKLLLNLYYRRRRGAHGCCCRFYSSIRKEARRREAIKVFSTPPNQLLLKVN